MAPEPPTSPPEFWSGIARQVTAQVEPALRLRSPRAPIIAYLRDLEAVARRECDSRQVIQIIASGRRVLGDRSAVGPKGGPFQRT